MILVDGIGQSICGHRNTDNSSSSSRFDSSSAKDSTGTVETCVHFRLAFYRRWRYFVVETLWKTVEKLCTSTVLSSSSSSCFSSSLRGSIPSLVRAPCSVVKHSTCIPGKLHFFDSHLSRRSYVYSFDVFTAASFSLFSLLLFVVLFLLFHTSSDSESSLLHIYFTLFYYFAFKVVAPLFAKERKVCRWNWHSDPSVDCYVVFGSKAYTFAVHCCLCR